MIPPISAVAIAPIPIQSNGPFSPPVPGSATGLLLAGTGVAVAMGVLVGAGVAVAIDGHIYQDALLQPIGADSEVHILPPIAGG